MENTLLFNVSRLPIKWHHENKTGNLFKSEAGMVDSNTGWVSSGITFELEDLSWVYYICLIVELALAEKQKATIAEVLRIINYLVAFRQGKDFFKFQSEYEKTN